MKKKTIKKVTLKKRWLVIIFILLIFSSFIFYSRFIATSGLKINEIKIVNNKLPDAFYGLKIVHFSDIHFGTTIKSKQFQNVINKIKILKPDILIFTGDLIDKNYKITNNELKSINKSLSSLEIPLGKYATLGEDDKNNTDALNVLETNQFMILKNTTDFVYNKNNTYISISGFDIDNYESDKMILTENIFNILITHKGDYLKGINNIDLALGGHSHNSQIQFPFIGGLFKKEGSKIYSEPYYKVNNTNIYISNGIGTTDYNFRFFNRPSINLFRLVK